MSATARETLREMVERDIKTTDGACVHLAQRACRTCAVDVALRLLSERGHVAGCGCGQHEELCYHQRPGDGCPMVDSRCTSQHSRYDLNVLRQAAELLDKRIQAAYRIGVARGGATIAGYFSVNPEKAKRELFELLDQFPALTEDEVDTELSRVAQPGGEEGEREPR